MSENINQMFSVNELVSFSSKKVIPKKKWSHWIGVYYNIKTGYNLITLHGFFNHVLNLFSFSTIRHFST